MGTYEPIKVRWYYLPYILAVALPWTLVIPAGIRQMLRQSRDNPARRRFTLFLLWWAGAMYLVLNIAGEKGHQYLLPLLPPLAVFAGAWVDATISGTDIPRNGWTLHATRLFTAAAILAGIALPLAPICLAALKIEAARLAGAQIVGGAALTAAMAVAAAYAWRGMRRRQWRTVWRALAVMTAVAGLSLCCLWSQTESMCATKPLMAVPGMASPTPKPWGCKLARTR